MVLALEWAANHPLAALVLAQRLVPALVRARAAQRLAPARAVVRVQVAVRALV